MANNHSKTSSSEQRESKLRVVGPNHSHPSYGAQQDEVLAEDVFHSMLTLEGRRAERSRKPFVLMLLDANLESSGAEKTLRQAVDVVVASKRETDLVGWYRRSVILGIIFTEVVLEGDLPVTETLRAKIESAFAKHLGSELASRVAVSMHIFPEGWNKGNSGWVEGSQLYPADPKRKVLRKRPPDSSTA